MNYGQLKAAFEGYLHRSDAAAMMPTFLELAEQRIYYGENLTPALRIPAMRATVSLASGTVPSDYLEAKKVSTSGSGAQEVTLTYRALDRIQQECRAYSWDGQTMVLSPDVSFPVDLNYYARLATPSADSDTNWLLENAPAIYLAAILIEGAAWSRDDDLQRRQIDSYASACTALDAALQSSAYSGSLLNAKPQAMRTP